MDKTKTPILYVIIAVLFVSVLYLIFQNYQQQNLVLNRLPSPTAYPTITSTPTSVVQPTLPPAITKVITSTNILGITVQHSKDWTYNSAQNTLSNKCNKIAITKSDAIQLELPILDYVKQFWGPNSDVSQMISALPKEYKFSFNNILPKDIIIIGPTGIGEVNNVYIRGPEGTGYYNISVTYIGPITGDTSICLGAIENDYKQILSTTKFTLPAITAKQACMANKSFQWSTKWNECYDVSYNQVEIQKLNELCNTYKGTFSPTASTCRHVVVTDTNPCGPEGVAVCNF